MPFATTTFAGALNGSEDLKIKPVNDAATKTKTTLIAQNLMVTLLIRTLTLPLPEVAHHCAVNSHELS